VDRATADLINQSEEDFKEYLPHLEELGDDLEYNLKELEDVLK